MINRNKTIIGFIALAMGTSIMNTSTIPALETSTNVDTQANVQSLFNDLGGEENTSNSTKSEIASNSTTGAAVNVSSNTSKSSSTSAPESSSTDVSVPAVTNTQISSDYVIMQQTENGTIILDESSSDETRGYLKYIIKPNDGYEIKDVIVDGQSIGVHTYYEFKNLTQSGHTISAVFKRIENHATGYIPEFIEVPYVYKADINNNLPSKFGLDEASDDSSYNTTSKNYISSVKNQGGLGVCWTFSALGTFESSLLKKYDKTNTDTYDFSENHMRYALSSDGGNKLGFDRANNAGGNFSMALAYLTRGEMNGAVNEGDDPYPTNTYSSSATASRTVDDISGKTVQNYYPTQVIRLGNLPSSATDTEKQARKDEVKSLIMKYGSVTLSYFSDGNYYNNCTSNGITTEAYYDPNATSGKTNHAVSIVGWDDNYSVDNFKTGYKPANPGAFLVKNNWGQAWGQNGYFYISYDDPNAFSEINAFKEIKSRDFFSNLYEYDTFGRSYTAGYGNHDQFYANVFNTKKSGLEKLSAISTYCNYPDSYIKLYVSTDGGNTFSEKTASSGYDYVDSKGYKIDETGYYTFILDNPIELNCDKFAVAIEVQQANNTDLIPLENKGSNTLTSQAVIDNCSYIGYNLNGLISNISNSQHYSLDTCIKAFTENTEVDKTILNNAIATANINKTTAVVSADGSDIDQANKWVTQSVMDAYTSAISAAQTVANNASATQTQVDTAVSNLATATTAFNNAKVAGTKVTAVDKTVLNNAIATANTNKTTAVVSADGSDVDQANKWVTQSVMDAYTAAIAAAQTVANNASATQTQVDTAVSNLAAATTTFNNAKASGTKVTAVDKTALQSLYNAHKNDTQGNYTNASWNAFTTALSNASTVLANANAIQSEVNASKSDLESAISRLIMKSSGGQSGSSGGSSGGSSSRSNSSSSLANNSDISSSNLSSLNSNISQKISKSINGEIKDSEILKTYNGNSVVCTDISSTNSEIFKVITTGNLNINTIDTISVKYNENTQAYIYIESINKYLPMASKKESDTIKFNAEANTTYVVTTNSLPVVSVGWNKIDTSWYMINTNGSMKTGWFKDTDGSWYNLSDAGKMKTGWFKDTDGSWYNLSDTGRMKTGWFKDTDGSWYNLSDAGKLKTGWFKDTDGKWYFLKSNGAMASNEYISGYYLGSDGAWAEWKIM